MKKITTLLFILAANFAIAQTNIKLNVQPGFKMHSTYNMKMHMSMMGKKMDMDSKYFISGNLESIDANQEMNWVFVVDSIIIDSKEGKEKKYINTNRPSTMKDAPKALVDGVGEKVIVKMDEYGKVIEEQKEKSSAMLASPSAIIKTCFVEFARKDLKIKDVWQMENTMDIMGQSVTTNTEYTLDSETETTYTIKANATNEIIEEPVVTTYIIDKKTGLIQSCNSTSEMKMLGSIKTNIDYNAKW